MLTQSSKVVPPLQSDANLSGFSQIIQSSLQALFQSGHEHKIITAAPKSSDGNVGDIYIVDSSSGKYLTWKTSTGWQNQSFTSLFINVKDYGAKGDGTTDDTSAIQLAINAAPVFGFVYFPAGRYIISNAIKLSSKDDVTLFAYGAQWYLKDNVLTDLLTTANSPSAGGGARPRILGLSIDGNKANNAGSGSTIFYGVDAGYIKDCYFKNMDGVAYFLIGATNWRVENSVADGAGASGFCAYNGSSNCWFVDCHGVNCSPNFLLQGKEVDGQSTSSGLHILGGSSVTALTSQDGVQVFDGVDGFSIVNLTISGSQAKGINVYSAVTGALSVAPPNKNGIISLCTIFDNGIDGIKIWDDGTAGATHILVSNNRCYDSGAATQTNGITLQGQADYIFVTDNDVIGNVSNGVLVGGGVNAHGKVWDNPGYTTKKSGATSVADGATINHGLAVTPTTVLVTTSVAAEGASVTAISGSTFTVALKKFAGGAGTTQTVYWQASAE